MNTTYESDFARIAFDEEANAIVTYWKKSVPVEHYKETFIHILKSLKQNKATAFVSDIKNQGTIGTTSRLWMQENILSEAIRHGLIKIGTSVSEETYTKFYSERAVNEIFIHNKWVEFRYFRQIEEALDWVAGPVYA